MATPTSPLPLHVFVRAVDSIKNLMWIGIKQLSNFQKFHHVYPPLSPFIFRHERLGAPQAICQFLLGHTGCFAREDQLLQEHTILPRIRRFCHGFAPT